MRPEWEITKVDIGPATITVRFERRHEGDVPVGEEVVGVPDEVLAGVIPVLNTAASRYREREYERWQRETEERQRRKAEADAADGKGPL